MYHTVLNKSKYEEEIKKSRFIAYVAPVSSREEAENYILSIKDKHKDARHNCSAYIVGMSSEIQKYDDDGEPQKTAGPPILEVLKKNNLSNIVCVVTRYFGGTLLGAGGLIRAYSSACSGALEKNKIVKMQEFIKLSIEYDYIHHGVLENYFLTNGYPAEEIQFSEKVTVTTYVGAGNLDKFLENLNDKTSAQHEVLSEEAVLMPVWENQLLVGEKTYRQNYL